MNGPFEPLEDLGLDLDESLVCDDGVCALPPPATNDTPTPSEP